MRRAAPLSAAFFLLPSAFCLASPPALRWTADVARPSPAEWTLLRGETRLLQPTVQEGRVPVAWPSNTVVELFWQTNGMGSAWWSAPASLGTATGQLSAVWSATNDVGASSYVYAVGARTTEGRTYSAHGVIRYRHAPGSTPNALDLPRQILDLALVTVTNAPWATGADLQAASNAIAGAVQGAVASLATTQDLAAVIAAMGTNFSSIASSKVDRTGDTMTGALYLPEMSVATNAAVDGPMTHDYWGVAWDPDAQVMMSVGDGRWRSYLGFYETELPAEFMVFRGADTNWGYWAISTTPVNPPYPTVSITNVVPRIAPVALDDDTWYAMRFWNDETYSNPTTGVIRVMGEWLVGPQSLSPSGAYVPVSPTSDTINMDWTGILPVVTNSAPSRAATLITVSQHDADPLAHPGLNWPSLDIATNIAWQVVVSNGHWLVYGTERP